MRLRLTPATPCEMDWSGMPGTDERRWCDRCGRHVHDLSAMDEARGLALLARDGPAPCVRFLARRDGTVLFGVRRMGEIARAGALAVGLAGCAPHVEPPAPSAAVPAEAALVVEVLDDSGLTIPGALVQIHPAGDTWGEPLASFVTDDDGRLSISALPEGAARWRVLKQGFGRRDGSFDSVRAGHLIVEMRVGYEGGVLVTAPVVDDHACGGATFDAGALERLPR